MSEMLVLIRTESRLEGVQQLTDLETQQLVDNPENFLRKKRAGNIVVHIKRLPRSQASTVHLGVHYL